MRYAVKCTMPLRWTLDSVSSLVAGMAGHALDGWFCARWRADRGKDRFPGRP